MFRTLSVLALILFTLSPGTSQGQDYVIGENDVLRVTVYDHPDLTSLVRVSANGTIMFPLIGRVSVADLSVDGVEKRLRDLLADGYIVNPIVSVFIEDYRSRKVTILGEVAKPGLYELTGDSTLLEIISKAGGLTPGAGERAVIKRALPNAKGGETSDESGTIAIDMNRLVEEGDNTLNLSVDDGDSIYIPRAGNFFVTGEVERPGSYKYEEGLTVLKAITTASGFTSKAARGKVRLIRRVDGVDTTVRVNMDDPVRPDDVLDVPTSFF